MEHPHINLYRLYKLTLILLIVTLFLFTSFLFHDIFLNSHPVGDEGKFLNDLIKVKETGLRQVILDGTSIPYLISSLLVNQVIPNPLLALKVNSLIIGILLFILLLLFDKYFLRLNTMIKYPAFLWLSYLFVIQSTLFLGVNDILLDLFGALFFISLLISKTKSYKTLLLAGVFLALMLFTRKMALTYISVIFFIFFVLAFLFNNNTIFSLKKGLMLVAIFGISFFAFNAYSLIKENTFSFDDKVLQGAVNWAQWDYHNALLVEAGTQERFSHVDIKETENFLIKNGKDALPSSFLEMIYFKPSLTIKEFFIDLATGIKYLIRQTGLMILPFLIFLWYRSIKIYKTKFATSTDFIYLFSFLYFTFICFIVITNIQGRWFMVFLPITMLLIAKDLSKLSIKSQLFFSVLNNSILVIMCIPYLIYKLNDFFELIRH